LNAIVKYCKGRHEKERERERENITQESWPHHRQSENTKEIYFNPS